MQAVMLVARLSGTLLLLVLVASMSLAQTGATDPTGAEIEAGSGGVNPLPKPQPVPTLEEKQERLAWCRKPANRTDPKCRGVSVPPEADEAGDG